MPSHSCTNLDVGSSGSMMDELMTSHWVLSVVGRSTAGGSKTTLVFSCDSVCSGIAIVFWVGVLNVSFWNNCVIFDIVVSPCVVALVNDSVMTMRMRRE